MRNMQPKDDFVDVFADELRIKKIMQLHLQHVCEGGKSLRWNSVATQSANVRSH